jgi:hypothetical protein
MNNSLRCPVARRARNCCAGCPIGVRCRRFDEDAIPSLQLLPLAWNVLEIKYRPLWGPPRISFLDVEITDEFATDEGAFRSKFPALAGVTITKAILPAFDRAKAQQWWEAH